MEKFVIKDSKIILLDGESEIGFIKFEVENDVLKIISTVVYDAYQGKGYAKTLMKECERYVREKGYKVEPICSYAKKYFTNILDLDIIE